METKQILKNLPELNSNIINIGTKPPQIDWILIGEIWNI